MIKSQFRQLIVYTLLISLIYSTSVVTAMPVTGEKVDELKAFDLTLISFMNQHDVPGASLAITRQGRIVYARGFGWADKERRIAVEPNSLFRIASLSKVITGVSILQLVEQGKINLEDKAFITIDIPSYITEGAHRDRRIDDITVRDLLNHTGGWARTSNPMGNTVVVAKRLGIQPPVTQTDLIRYMQGRSLDYPPGMNFEYSNFGYCVLGRIIEKVSGKSYREYVTRNVLYPLGITDMQLGKRAIANRAPGEVTYYDPHNKTRIVSYGPFKGDVVASPYGGNYIEVMDSHGGWLASSIDLGKFLACFDIPTKCPILNQKTISLMFSRPQGPAGYNEDGKKKRVYYSCGWNIRPKKSGGKNTWLTGNMSGTSALMVRRHDGLNWVVLFNMRNNKKGVKLSAIIDPLLHRAANSVQNWPSIAIGEKKANVAK